MPISIHMDGHILTSHEHLHAHHLPQGLPTRAFLFLEVNYHWSHKFLWDSRLACNPFSFEDKIIN